MNIASSPSRAAPASSGEPASLVLVVEDEDDIADILLAYLRRDGFRTLRSANGEDALQLFQQQQPQLVLLDIQIPGIDGVDVLRHIRADGDTPVIMLTAFVDDVDKLLSLRLGADDYVTKPFNPAEVVARVRAVLRRSSASPARPASTKLLASLRVGTVEIDLNAHRAYVPDTDGKPQPLPLTLTEFRLLACLAAQPQRCFTRSHLIETCLPESDALDRVVDSHLSKLRRKLIQAGQGELIETVRGIGYRLCPAS